MPVSDASAKRAAAWLAAWARAGLLGSDPEVAGYVADLIQFVGERTMENHGELYLDVCGALGWGYDPNSDPVPSVLRAVPDLLARVRELECQLAGEQKANALLNAGMGDVCEGRDQLKHRARELEADNARLRGLVAELRACDPAYKLAKAVSDFPVGERTMDKDRQQGVPRRIVLVDREDPEDYLEVAQVYGFGAPRVSLFANQEGEVCGVTLGVAEAKTLAAFLLAFAEKEGGDQ